GGDFNVAANWKDATTNQNHVPGPGDDAVITTGNITVTVSDAEAVNSLDMTDGTSKLVITGTGHLSLANGGNKIAEIQQLNRQSNGKLSTAGTSATPTYLENGGASAGTIDAATGAVVDYYSGTFLVNSGTTFTGAGTDLVSNSGTVTLNTDVAIS